MNKKMVQKQKPYAKASDKKAKKTHQNGFQKNRAPSFVEKQFENKENIAEKPLPNKVQVAQRSSVDLPGTSGLKLSPKPTNEKKKVKIPRTFKEICADISSAEAKNTSVIDRFVSLLLELLSVKPLTSDQVQHFFASVNEEIEDAWSPFLVKAATHINPAKLGNNQLIANEIIICCHDILESCGLSMDDMHRACMAFCESKEASCITDYLRQADMTTPQKSEDSVTLEVHKITPQELACVSFICFNYSFREYSPNSLAPLVTIDRAIAEYFSKPSLKDHAGKTLGNALGSKVFSPKKITELIYLYDGTTETIQKQGNQIKALKDEVSHLREKNTALNEEITSWKGNNANLVSRIENLEAESARYRQERTEAEGRLEYERNKFERQIEMKEAGIAEELSGDIELEIQAIREIIEYIDSDDQRRIRRRLQRIDDILQEYGGKENA